jgi:hypothetical protein
MTKALVILSKAKDLLFAFKPTAPSSLLSSGEVAEGSRGGQDAAKQLLAGETKVCEANVMSIPIGVRQGIRTACCPPAEQRLAAAKRAPCKGGGGLTTNSVSTRAVVQRVTRMELGNFGDRKLCRVGVCELSIDVGVRYRVYYAVADKAHLNAPQLYRTLSPDGNPVLSSLSAILKAMGCALRCKLCRRHPHTLNNAPMTTRYHRQHKPGLYFRPPPHITLTRLCLHNRMA